MLILAIDSSSQVSAVALGYKDKIIAEYNLNIGLTHSETLMPLIEEIIKRAAIDKKEISYIAVSSGPGSFTGLRIAASIAKGIAKGLNIQLIPIPTLDFLAYNIKSEKLLCPIMDARREQVYTAVYDSTDKNIIYPYSLIDINKLLEKLASYEKDVIFLGDACQKYSKEIIAYSEKFYIAETNNQMQRASSLLSLAFERIDLAVNANDFEINYLRKPQAERELEARQNDKD